MRIQMNPSHAAVVAAAVAAAWLCATAVGAPLADPNGPIVTAPKGGGAGDLWQKFAICVSKHTGRRVTVGAPPGFGINIAGPSQPYASPADEAAARARMRAAGVACGRILAPIQPDFNSSAFEAKFRDAMLSMARCIRRHGINVGDPIIKKLVGGGYNVTWPAAPGVSTSGPRWNDARKACQYLVTPLFQSK
jgi:hypothetical protein